MLLEYLALKATSQMLADSVFQLKLRGRQKEM